MKQLFFALVLLTLLTSVAYGKSCNQVVSDNVGNPDLTYNELNSTLKQNGCMYMAVSKVFGDYTFVDFAYWEIIFKKGKVVYAENYIKNKKKEKEGLKWFEKFIQSDFPTE